MLLKDLIIFTIVMYTGGLVFMFLEADKTKEYLSPRKEISNLKSLIIGRSNLSRNYVEKLFQSVEKAIQENGVREPYIWDYYESCFFVGSLLTTIGYGHIAPRTNGGRSFAILLGLLGIPLTVIVVRNLSKNITDTVIKIVHLLFKAKERLRKVSAGENQHKIDNKPSNTRQEASKSEEHRNQQKCEGNNRHSCSDKYVKIARLIMLLILVFMFLMFSATVRMISEGWSMQESLYFWFMTLTTVGFGDYVPYDGRRPNTWGMTVIYYIGTFYLLLGLALIASLIQCISVILEGRLPAITVVPLDDDGEHAQKHTSQTEESHLNEVFSARHGMSVENHNNGNCIQRNTDFSQQISIDQWFAGKMAHENSQAKM